jgi:3'-5' exoribonuclease 1
MRYVIVDLEATCWEKGYGPEESEIIEIGAVRMDSADGPVADEFGSFIRPVAHRTLSAFCTDLTSITQADVDGADHFWEVFPRFLEWAGDEPFVFCSWGNYDRNQIGRDCARHGFPYPDALGRHLNLKAEFARRYATRQMGMAHALERLGLPLKGTHHRGLDDARNIAKIARHVLPPWEEENSEP